jgi:hypothetical protein
MKVMSEQNVQDQAVALAPEEEAKYKAWMKAKYGIEDEPEKFRESYANARKAAEDLPKYHATLEALITAAREAEEASVNETVQRDTSDDKEDERLRLTFRADPLEGTKKLLERQNASLEKKLEEIELRATQRADINAQSRDVRRQAAAYVRNAWPEAYDRNSELHKMGKSIYDREMSQEERNDPRSFLIATERAAGRMGIAPMNKRTRVNVDEDSSEQNVSRQSRRPSNPNEAPKLTSDQKKYADLMKVSHKTYALMKKQRDEQNRRKKED